MTGSGPSTTTKDAGEIIRRAGNEWAEHWNKGDLKKVAEFYAADAVYLPPHHAAVHGHDAIMEYLKGPISHGVTDLSFEVTFIRQIGDLAYDVGKYTMTVPQKEETKKKEHGKYLTVWKRQPNGEWRIVADSWSSDLPAGH